MRAPPGEPARGRTVRLSRFESPRPRSRDLTREPDPGRATRARRARPTTTARDGHGEPRPACWQTRCSRLALRLRGVRMRWTVASLAFLLAATPALAQDLTGYYRVTGDLPGPGGAYRAVAAFSPSGATTYRVRVIG